MELNVMMGEEGVWSDKRSKEKLNIIIARVLSLLHLDKLMEIC